jgi:hypothetical protein
VNEGEKSWKNLPLEELQIVLDWSKKLDTIEGEV